LPFSSAQEKDSLRRATPAFRVGEGNGGEVAVEVEKSGFVAEKGTQVAVVNASTSLRMKKRGNVPPRLEALGCYQLLWIHLCIDVCWMLGR